MAARGAWRAFLATSPRPTLSILRWGVPATWQPKSTGGAHADAARSASPATTETRLRGSEPLAYVYPWRLDRTRPDRWRDRLAGEPVWAWECNVPECGTSDLAPCPSYAGDDARQHLAREHGITR